jgi:hypothetical protein
MFKIFKKKKVPRKLIGYLLVTAEDSDKPLASCKVYDDMQTVTLHKITIRTEMPALNTGIMKYVILFDQDWNLVARKILSYWEQFMVHGEVDTVNIEWNSDLLRD